jgi:hypothetical protein
MSQRAIIPVLALRILTADLLAIDHNQPNYRGGKRLDLDSIRPVLEIPGHVQPIGFPDESTRIVSIDRDSRRPFRPQFVHVEENPPRAQVDTV